MSSPFPAVPGAATPGAASPGDPGGAAVVVATVVNQWEATFTQPTAFQTTPSALQSTVIALDSGTSVGGGTGTPSAGNWLICITGMNEQFTTSGFTVGDADDIHSFWRPAKVSTATALTRASVWYTPNLARVAGDVYVAPNGCLDGEACLVVEVSGLGPWDVITVSASNYAAAATSLNLATAAPSAASFMIAAVVGDNSSAGQAFAPATWTTLHTVTATNGTNHVSDVVLTSAYLASNTGSISVNGTASSAEDLSGVIIGIELNAPSPIPSVSGVAPGWPGRMIVEAALGAGFETPQDQLTWTVLNDSAIAPGSEVKRFWGWADQSGIPYALAQLQSSTGTATLDNADGAITPSNSASSYYPNITTGTPVRLRVALGTLTGPLGSVAVNRWYVVQRNMLNATERRDSNLRNFVDIALTDIWSVAGGSCPTPYRGEIAQDNPYAVWACDDQPLAGGVQPTSLLNSAPGNTKPLQIIASAAGVSAGDQYATSGLAIPPSSGNLPSVAVSAVGQLAGWMYGDPQSSPSSYSTGNPVTSSPGSAAWQQTGLLGTGGSNTWFLACNDTSFPPLSGGVTIKSWHNPAFFGTSTLYHSTSTGLNYDVCGQPYSQITLWTIATSSNAVAILYLDISGHLILETFSGSTGTTHSIYTASDLRCGTFFSVDVSLTTTTWTVLVNGGLTASASGSATGMTSAWTWIAYNGDMGTAGGSSLASVQHGGNVAYSSLAVFPSVLPVSRLLAHYCAAITGFGVLPAPQTVAISTVASGYTPDGSTNTGSYGVTGVPMSPVDAFTISALAVTVAGSYTSGPSARAITAGYGTDTGGTPEGDSAWMSWTNLSPLVNVYTSAAADSETEAAVVNGSGDAFTSGYGASAVDTGVCSTGGGSGASPPTAPSSLGDSVTQRVERVLAYGGITYPGRAIDTTPNLVQAALDVGGQQVGANIQSMVQGDNGWWFVDSPGNICYRAKAKLAADTTVWDLSSAGLSYGLPFQASQTFPNDPTKVWNIVQIAQYSPDGASLPVTTPANASAVNASQNQYGPRPLPWNSSYLQSPSEIQLQANWLILQYGSVHRRVESLTVDAAGYPPAWLLVLAINPGDLVSIVDQPMQGGPQSTGTYRVSSVSRRIFFGANGSKPEGSVTINCDYEPTSYWS